MNRIYGYIDPNGKNKIELKEKAAFFLGDWARIYIEKDDTEFIKKIETEKTWLVMTGYFDQPLNSDTLELETLIYKYERTGSLPEVDCYGSFQIALIDKQTHEVKLFCDRGGLRNWFVYECEGTIYFSSKIDVFNAPFDLNMEPNNGDRDYALIFGYYPDNHTVYEGVTKINADDCLILSKARTYSIKFTDVKEIPVCNLSNEEEIIDNLYKKFMTVIENQVRGHKKVAVYLGGFDSALVTSILKRLGKQVETFTFFFENDKEFNQTHTDTLSKYLGIRHHWVPITSDIYKHNYLKYKEVFDQPTNWPNYVIQTAYITQILKDKGFTIALSGDGCDTLFQGYPGVNRSAKLYNKISPFIKPISGLLIFLFDSKYLETKMGHVYRLVMRIIRNARIADPVRTFLMFRVFDESSIAHAFMENRKSIEKNIQYKLETLSQALPKDMSLNKLAYAGRSNMGPNRLKLSGSMDLTGVSIFSPFMHNEIKALVMSFPDELMRPKGSGDAISDIGKYILTKMAQKYRILPDEIIFQKKQAPVNSPIDRWYENEFRPMILDVMMKNKWSPSLDTQFINGMCNRKPLEEYYKNIISADKVASHALSLLLTTVVFYLDDTEIAL